MKPQQQQQQDNTPNLGFNPLVLFISFAALPLELVLHNVCTFGLRSAGSRGAGAVLMMYVFALCYTCDDRVPLFLWTIATAVLCIIAHISAMVRYGHGDCSHTRYNGRPYAMAFLPISEARLKRIEPSFGVAAGWALHHWNCPLGSFLMTSASCYGIQIVADFLFTRTRALDVNDALAEQTIALQARRRSRRR